MSPPNKRKTRGLAQRPKIPPRGGRPRPEPPASGWAAVFFVLCISLGPLWACWVATVAPSAAGRLAEILAGCCPRPYFVAPESCGYMSFLQPAIRPCIPRRRRCRVYWRRSERLEAHKQRRRLRAARPPSAKWPEARTVAYCAINSACHAAVLATPQAPWQAEALAYAISAGTIRQSPASAVVSAALVAMLQLLSGDIETNPGPASVVSLPSGAFVERSIYADLARMDGRHPVCVVDVGMYASGGMSNSCCFLAVLVALAHEEVARGLPTGPFSVRAATLSELHALIRAHLEDPSGPLGVSARSLRAAHVDWLQRNLALVAPFLAREGAQASRSPADMVEDLRGSVFAEAASLAAISELLEVEIRAYCYRGLAGPPSVYAPGALQEGGAVRAPRATVCVGCNDIHYVAILMAEEGGLITAPTRSQGATLPGYGPQPTVGHAAPGGGAGAPLGAQPPNAHVAELSAAAPGALREDGSPLEGCSAAATVPVVTLDPTPLGETADESRKRLARNRARLRRAKVASASDARPIPALQADAPGATEGLPADDLPGDETPEARKKRLCRERQRRKRAGSKEGAEAKRLRLD